MTWLLVIIAAFLLLAWIGRQSRLGKLKAGPWFQQFRAVRSVISVILLAIGVSMLARGAWAVGLGLAFLSLLMSSSVRFSGSFQTGPRRPDTVGSYSAEEIRAYQTLELSIGADRKAIKEAWKRLMKTAHPDQGGDVSRASALNAARDLLLRRR